MASEIQQFYEQKSLFITGGTGFVGGVIIEKLLRVCNLKQIYVLVRHKKGKTPEERIKTFFDQPIFASLKIEKPNYLDSVTLVEGDCYKKKIGLSEQNEKLLKKVVNVFIHGAANLRFDQPLSDAIQDVHSLMESVQFAKEIENLLCYIYVSTAYSNCIYSEISERFYTPPITAENLLKLIEATSTETFNKIEPIILGSYPNSYVFVKSVNEHYIKEHAGDLNCAIVRPGIVISTADEPIPGWIDNFYGVVGIVIACSLGALRSLNCNPNFPIQVLPCDFVANNTIAIAWQIATNCGKRAEKIPIYNYAGVAKSNTITWGEWEKEMEALLWEFPPTKMFWFYTFKFRPNLTWHKICVFFQHTVTAYIADFILMCLGRERIAVKNYDRLQKLLDVTIYFTSKTWHWHTENVDDLWRAMTQQDKALFNFDMPNLSWKKYVRDSVIGGRIYLHKDPLETVPYAQKKMRYLQILHYTLKALFYYFIYKLIIFVWNLFF